MHKRTLVAAALGLALASQDVVAADTTSVEPASQWVLDYADEHCTLARAFGSGDTAATLRISSYGSWNDFELFLSGPLLSRAMAPLGTVRVAFAADTEKRDLQRVLKGTVGVATAVTFPIYFGPYDDWYKGRMLHEADRTRYILEHDQARPDFDRQTEGLTLDFDDKAPIYLHLQNMAAPLAALRDCVDDLYKSWGLDPAVQKALSRRPKALPSTVADLQRHYPSKLLGKRTNGYVRVRLKIDPTGHPTSCAIQDLPAEEAFKRSVCDHLTGGFEPALDEHGQPVEAVFFTSVIFFG